MSAAEVKKRLVAAKSQYIELAKQDIVDALNQFRDLVPDLEKFKFPDKDNEQRITFKLKGTIPMCYRETVYNILISIYLSPMHPYHSPVCYVNPTEDMVIRSNENVSEDGRVYLPYLHEWRYPGYDLTGLIQILAMIFGEKCPVFSKKSGKTASQSTSVNPWPTPTPMYMYPEIQNRTPSWTPPLPGFGTPFSQHYVPYFDDLRSTANTVNSSSTVNSSNDTQNRTARPIQPLLSWPMSCIPSSIGRYQFTQPPNSNESFDVDDVEDFVKQEIEEFASTIRCEERLPLTTIKRSLKNKNDGGELSELDDRVITKIWISKILDRWVDEAVEAFEKSFRKRCDSKMVAEKLAELNEDDFWKVKILNKRSIQKVISNHKDLFDSTVLSTALESFQERCYAHLKYQNIGIARELKFFEEFLRVIREEADEKFLQPFREIVRSDVEVHRRFVLLLGCVLTNGIASLKIMAQMLINEKEFYFPGEFFEIVGLFFKPISKSIYEKDGVSILEVSGSAFSISELDLAQTKCKEIHLISQISIKLNRSIVLPGVNILIKTPRLLVPEKVQINTTGRSKTDKYTSDAGRDSLGNGNDGSDGKPGESAGNVYIKVDRINCRENLEIVANGGDGSWGQDGGTGIDGVKGEAMTIWDLKEKMPGAAAFLVVNRGPRVSKILCYIEANLSELLEVWWSGGTGGSLQQIWQDILNRRVKKVTTDVLGFFTSLIPGDVYGTVCIYVKARLKNGMVVTFAWECGGHIKWINCQSYLLVKGTEATPEKDGGLGGMGGQGGFPGSIVINGQEDGGLPGKNGENGKRGKNGQPQKNGWDVGWTEDSTGSEPIYKGGNHDMKLEIVPFYDRQEWRHVCPYRRDQNLAHWVEIQGTSLPNPIERETSRGQERRAKVRNQVMAVRKSNVHINELQRHESDVFATAQKLMNALQKSHKENSELLVGSSLEQHKNQVRASMSITRQIEFHEPTKKRQDIALHEIGSSHRPFENRDLFLIVLYKMAERLELSQEDMQTVCHETQCSIKDEDHFLQKCPKESWSEDFQRFIAVFNADKEASNMQQFFSFFNKGLDLPKAFQELQKNSKSGTQRVLREFVFEILEIKKNDTKWYENLVKKFWQGKEEKPETTISDLKDGYNFWYSKKKRDLIVFEESLEKLDETAVANQEVMKKFGKHLQEKPSLISTCHIELIAQLQEVQVQFFVNDGNDKMVLTDIFNPKAKKVLKVTFGRDEELFELKVNASMLRLEQERLQKSIIYDSILGSLFHFTTPVEVNQYFKRKHFLQLETENPKPFEKLESPEKALARIKSCLRNNTSIWKRLNFITEPYIGTNRILHALADRFQCEGCLLAEEEMSLFINTVLEISRASRNFVDLFLWIIVASSQRSWLVECGVLVIENFFERSMHSGIVSKFRSLSDKRIIFHLLERLSSLAPNTFSFEDFENLVHLLQIATPSINLIGLELKQWPFVLKINYWAVKLQEITKWGKSDDLLQRTLHYLTSIEILYKEDSINKLLSVFAEKKDQITSKIVLQIFEALYSEKVFLTEKFLKILSAQPVDRWSKKLDIDNQSLRKLDRLIEIIENNNRTSKSIATLLPMLKKMTRKVDSFKKEMPHSKEEIQEWTRKHQSRGFFSNLYADLTNSSMAELLAVVIQAIHLKEGFVLRDTQKIAILLFCLSEGKSRVLEQVSTGEGKSLIVASLAIIRALRGEKVDVITSSSVLARRDAEMNRELYEMFNLTVNHNCSESLQERTDVYQTSSIVYGEITNFQRDFLLDRFYGKNILGARQFESVIVDEVDSMLLDKGNNVLYLSHQIAGFDKLESVLLYIWQLVNRPVKNQKDYDLAMDTEHLRQNVIDNMYKRVTRDDLKRLSTEEATVNCYQLWNEMLQEKIIDEKGRLLIEERIKQEVNKIKSIDQATRIRLVFLLNETIRKQCMAVVPNFLIDFVEAHLSKWIENAKTALYMMAGNDYVVDIDRTGVKHDLHANITILDRDTGTDQASSQWEECLHQFLQLKHGCRMSLMSLKAIFISNVSYFKRYKNLFGLTGTLGSVHEMDLLKQIHDVDYVTIPTACGKKFYEETPIICGREEEWIKRIYEDVCAFSHQRSVLVICETVEGVNFVEKSLTAQGLNNIFAYRREHEKFTVADRSLLTGQVIVATNLAGRGTDIKISDALRDAGGLHICLTYLPSNKRVEEQAFGRAARSGDPGSGRLVILKDDTNMPTNDHQIVATKVERDSDELKRITEIKEHYEKRILAEEYCFEEFNKLYQAQAGKFQMGSVYKVNLLENLIDQWALWLDRWKQIINNDGNGEAYKKQLALFVEQAREFPTKRTFILMPHLVRLAKKHIEQESYDDAIDVLNHVINFEPQFSEAAHYYKAYAIGKSFSWEFNRSESSRVVDELEIAKKMFEKLSDSQLQYSAIVTKMKENFESVGIIQITSYEEQKQGIVGIYGQFIAAIDEAIGSAVSSESFYKGIINEEMSSTLYDLFYGKKVLLPMKTSKPDDLKKIERVAREFGIPLETLTTFLQKGYQGDAIQIEKALRECIPLPNRDDFWDELLSNGWLIKPKTFVGVDKERFFREYPLLISDKDFIGNSREIREFKEEISGLVLKTPEPLNEMLETSKVFEKEAFMRLIQKVRYETFFQKGLIVELDVAERGESSKDFAFKSFDKLRIEDFSGEHIRIEIASAVLQELVKSKVLKKEGTDYRLRVADLNDYNLPLNFRLYYDAVDALLARSFAYRLAFNRMTRQKDGSINIPMLHKPHQQLLWDLVDAAAIAPVTVGSWDSVSRILEAQYPEYFSRETLIEIMRQEVPGLTVNKAWNLLREKGHLTEAVFSSTYTITDKQVTIYGGDYETTNNRLQNCLRGQMLLRKETTKQEIAGIIDHLKGLIITLDCPEPYLQELYDALGSRAPAAMEEINIFMLNGLNDIIRFKEQPYTWKMIFYTTLTVVMGLVQIAIGIAIQLFTVGLMSHVGVGFISEGVGDLIFAVSAMRSGYFSWSAYWQHKKESIMFTVVTCGIGAFFARGAQVSRYGAKFAQQGLKSAGKEVASKAGKELIKEVGWSTVRNTVLKDFALHAIKGVALGVTSQAVAALVDNHLRELCVGFAASFYQQIRESAKKHKISQTIDKLYAHLGARKSKELFESHLRSALSERAFNETTSEAFLRYGVHVSRQIGDGLGSMNRQSSTPYSFSYIATLVLKLADYVSIAKNLYELGTLVDQLLDRVNNSLLGCSEMLNSQPVNNDREERENFKKSSLDFMNDQMNEQIGTIIGKKFVEPLLQTGANYLVNYLGRHIKKQYRSYKNYEHAQEFEKTKKEYEAKRKEAIESEANEETRKSIDQKYHSTLNDLKKRVRDPKLYAAILREGGHMDMQSLKAYAGVLDAHLKANGSKKGYLIEVKGNDGTSFTLQCGDPENVTKVELQVDQEHFTPLQHGTQMNESSGGDYDCLLNALKSEISELDMDNRMLREQIARRVETDLEIGETIRSGQHALGIRRGLYGGIRNRQNSEGANQIERTERWEFKEKVDVDLRNNGTRTRTNQEQVQDAHVEAVKLLERLVNCYTDDKELRGASGNREIDVDNVRDSVIKAMNDAGLETPIQLDETKFKATKYVEKKQEGKESVWVPVQFEYYEAEGQPGITIRPKLNRSGTETCEMRLRLEYNVDNPIVPDNGPPHPHIGYTCRVTNGPAQFRNITGHIIFDDNPNLPGRQRSGMRSYENLPTQARVVDVDWTKTGNARPTRKDGPPRRNSFIGILPRRQ